MNRILLEPAEIGSDGRAILGGARAEHIRSVLHGEVGQRLKTGVVGGLVGFSAIEAVSSDGVTISCRHDEAPLAPWCDLILAPPRPRVLKRLLPQLATIGVRRLVLVGAEKVEKAFWGAQLLKEEIYRPLLVEGLMQGAVSTTLPQIDQCRNLPRWFEKGGFSEMFGAQPQRVIAHPYADEAHQAAASSPEADGSAAVPVFAIGPEGGWTDAEVALFEAHGFVRHGLGARILKTETAAIALLSRFLPN